MRRLCLLTVWCVIGMSLSTCQEHPTPPSPPQPTAPVASKPAYIGMPAIDQTLENFGFSGSVHVMDEETNTAFHSDSAGYYKKNVPASTFKIFTSLIALEKGLLRDQYEVKPWKNRVQKNEDWNKDQDLKEAFAESTNWFFEDLTRALGKDTLNAWLDRIGYPVHITNNETKFWLDEDFVISPEQQIALMQKLAHGALPFSQRTFDITRDIMLRKDTLGIRIYGKTGWGTPQGINVGWYVGWAEFPNRKPIYFATCIEHAEPAHEHFDQWRKHITELALQEVYPNGWKTQSSNLTPQ